MGGHLSPTLFEVVYGKFYFVLEKMLNKMKLFGKIRIFEKKLKIKLDLITETENMFTLNHGK